MVLKGSEDWKHTAISLLQSQLRAHPTPVPVQVSNLLQVMLNLYIKELNFEEFQTSTRPNRLQRTKWPNLRASPSRLTTPCWSSAETTMKSMRKVQK